MLDTRHNAFCSCAKCIDWYHDTKIRETQREYRESYDLPRKRKHISPAQAELLALAGFLLIIAGLFAFYLLSGPR
jgi:hypothetical protein